MALTPSQSPRMWPLGNTANLLLMLLLTVLLTSTQVPVDLLRGHGRGENRVPVGPGIGLHSLFPSSRREGTTCKFPLETGPGRELLEKENAWQTGPLLCVSRCRGHVTDKAWTANENVICKITSKILFERLLTTSKRSYQPHCLRTFLSVNIWASLVTWALNFIYFGPFWAVLR